jgi:pyruvate dehydrogenase phosphatase
MGIYNNIKRTFKVGVTSDSRAVLGRRAPLKADAYAYETHILSADQNADNPHEVERTKRLFDSVLLYRRAGDHND